MKKLIKEIIKQNEEKFEEMERNFGWLPEHKERVKSHLRISQLRLIQEIVKMVEGMNKIPYKIKLIQPFQDGTEIELNTELKYINIAGYNQALSDIVAQLEVL